jgi:HAD superfamily hydrolase (TIGR01509 family)
LQKPEAILFDLDGVLVDACEWHYESLNLALRDFGLDEISREQHVSTFNGLPTKVKLNMLGIDGGLADRVNRRKQDRTLEIIKTTAKTDHTKVELLSHLKANGIMVACVTNSIRETATAMLNATGQLNYIDLLVSNEDVVRNKPHPDCYDLAIERMRVDPDRCLCVEDSPKGIAAAHRSRAKSVCEVSNPTDVCLSGFLKYLRGEEA